MTSASNTDAVDAWSWVHFATGFGVGVLDISWKVGLGGAVVYEVAEQALERSPQGREIFGTSHPESLANAVVDVAIFAAGQWVGKKLHKSRRKKGRR